MKRKIYVASSWRNGYYPEVVEKLREETTVAKNATVTYGISVIKFFLTTARLLSKHAILVAKSTNPKDFPHFICISHKKAVPLQPFLKNES